jgi:hypothetical protein
MTLISDKIRVRKLRKLIKEAKEEQKSSKSLIYQNWIIETEKEIKRLEKKHDRK